MGKRINIEGVLIMVDFMFACCALSWALSLRVLTDPTADGIAR